MRALESRGAELASKVAQLEALREVGEAVGSSLDLDEVLDRIVSNAVRLTNLGFGDITLGTDGGSIMEYDESSDSFHVRAAFGSSPDLLEQLRAITIHRESTLVGRTALARRPLEVPDLAQAELDPHLEILFRDGWRSVLAVPMLRGDKMVGVLVIRRRGTGTFPPDVIELLQTFASQSALAIVNARLFRELETKTSELEIASRHKSEFLASMSHELRTPLNAVIGFSEVLLDRMFGEINERQDEYLHDIWNSGRHLLELLNEILDLSKVEAGQMVLEPSMFRVDSALEYSLAMVRERATLHAITVTVQVDDDVGTIEADELRFKQVVLNLLSNAVKFTPDGGSVSIRAYREGTELVVTVKDTGIGVPPEDQERIFESFQQGRRGAPKEEGTGLGLTLSRRIVGLFGGRMWLESTPGVGSTFGFSIPGLPAAGGRSRLAWEWRASRRSPRRRRPGIAGSHLGLPRRFADSGAAGPGRRRGSRGDPPGCCRPPLCLKSGCHALMAGRCLPSSRRTPRPPPSQWSSPPSSTIGPGAWPSARTCISASQFVATSWSTRCDALVPWPCRSRIAPRSS